MSVTNRSPEVGTGLGHDHPLWVIAGQGGIVIAIFLGFGATQEIQPKLFLLLLFVATATMLALGPVGAIGRLTVATPVLLYLGWWVLSFAWTANPGGFVVDSQVALPLILALVTIASVLPSERFTGALIAGCLVTIAWTALYTAAYPDYAMVLDDGEPGWRGGFTHKNGMAPFMLFAVITLWYLDRNRVRRTMGIAAAVFFIVVAQSTTALVVGGCLFLAGVGIRTLTTTVPQLRTTVLAFVTTLIAMVAGALILALPHLTDLLGKDPTLSRRTEIWDGVLRVLVDRPLHGFGIGGVWIDQAASQTVEIHRGLGFVVFHSHNGFLEVALQLGLVGLALYLGIVFGLARRALGGLDTNPTMAAYTLSFLTLVVLTSISEVTTFGIWLALAAALYTVALRDGNPSPRVEQPVGANGPSRSRRPLT